MNSRTLGLMVMLCAALCAGGSAVAANPPGLVTAGFSASPGTDERDGWTAIAVEEMLNARLRRSQAFQVVPTVRCQDAQRELTDADGKLPDWLRVTQMLGAAWLVSGESTGPAYAVRIVLRITPVAPGAKPQEHTIGPARINEALDQATTLVLEAGGVKELPLPIKTLVYKPPTESPTALEYYARAISSARAGNWADAVRYVKRAIDYEATFVPAQLALAQVESRTTSGARTAALRLRQLRLLAKASEDPWDAAEVERIEGVLLCLTENAQTGAERLMNAAAAAEKNGDAYSRVLALDTLVDVLIRRANELVEEKGANAEASHNDLLQRAAMAQRSALEQLAALNDLVTQASDSNRLALLLERVNDLQGAEKQHLITLELTRRLGVRQSEATALMFLGQCYRHAEKYPEALDAMNKCLALAAPASQTGVRLALGDIRKATHDDAGALREYEAAFDLVSKGDNLPDQYACLKRLADLRRKLGQRKEAEKNLQEAIDVAQVLKAPDLQALREQLEGWRREKP